MDYVLRFSRFHAVARHQTSPAPNRKEGLLQEPPRFTRNASTTDRLRYHHREKAAISIQRRYRVIYAALQRARARPRSEEEAEGPQEGQEEARAGPEGPQGRRSWIGKSGLDDKRLKICPCRTTARSTGTGPSRRCTAGARGSGFNALVPLGLRRQDAAAQAALQAQPAERALQVRADPALQERRRGPGAARGRSSAAHARSARHAARCAPAPGGEVRACSRRTCASAGPRRPWPRRTRRRGGPNDVCVDGARRRRSTMCVCYVIGPSRSPGPTPWWARLLLAGGPVRH